MSDLLKVECPHCGGSLKLKDRTYEGKKVRCVKCQEVFKVELPAEDVEFVDDLEDDFGFGSEDELPEEDEAPRTSKGNSSKKGTKKKRKSGGAIPWLMIGIAGLLLVAVGGLGVVAYTFIGAGGGSSNKIDLTYIPADANVVMHLKVNELIGSPLLAEVLNQPEAKQMLDQQAQTTGFSARDIVSITAGAVVDESGSALKMSSGGLLGPRGMSPPTTPPRKITVVRSSVPFNAEAIGVTLHKGVAQVQNSRTFYQKQNRENFGPLGGNTLYFPEPNVMLIGTEADIVGLVNTNVKQIRRTEYDFINPNMTLLVAFAPKSKRDPSAPLESPADQPIIQGLERASNKAFRAGAFGIRLSDRLDLEILINCADGASAGELKSATEALFADLKTQFERSKTMLVAMNMNDVVALADKSLASLKVEQSGVLLTAAGTIPSDVKAVGTNLAGKLPGMMGMGMGMGGPPGGRMGRTPDLQPESPSSLNQESLPQNFPDPSQLPTGELPPGTLPPGGFPPGTVPPGTLPPGTFPPGIPQPGLPQPGATPTSPK